MTEDQGTRRDFYVYAYYRDDVPIYIGKGRGKRWLDHRSRSRKANRHLYRILMKDEAEKVGRVTCRKLFEGLTNEEALALEISLIAQIGRRPNGTLVNLTDGGEGASGYRHSEETKLRISRLKSDSEQNQENLRRLAQAIRAAKHCRINAGA